MRHAAHAAPEESEELNLTPYLDVILNLVMFLLVSFTVVSSFRVIDVSAPAICTDCNAGSLARFSPVVLLTADAVLVSASDGSVPSERLEGPLDVRRLTETLASWKQRYGLGEDLTVAASPETPYAEIVRALDAAREDEGLPLFPTARLAAPKG